MLAADLQVHAGHELTVPLQPEFEHALLVLSGDAGLADQTLEERAGGVTLYRSDETFRGLLASSVPLADVQDGFERHARALKARAEELSRRPAGSTAG